MKLVLNNINDISLSNISIYRNRIFLLIDDIKLIGICFSHKKDMIQNENRYIINFNDPYKINRISQINNIFKINLMIKLKVQ